MSFLASATVLYADLPIYEKMVLGVLADHANDQGDGAWPSVERIALLAGRISERQVQRCLRRLQDMSFISISQEATRHRPTEYRLHLDVIRASWVTESHLSNLGATDGRRRDDPESPEPIQEPIPQDVSNETSFVPAPIPIRKRDDLWDAMVAIMGHSPTTKSERGRWNKAIKELRDIDATPEMLALRASSYKLRWPDIEMTPTAIVSHWDRLATLPPGSVTTRIAQLRAAQNESPALDWIDGPCDECNAAPGEITMNGRSVCPACWDSL